MDFKNHKRKIKLNQRKDKAKARSQGNGLSSISGFFLGEGTF